MPHNEFTDSHFKGEEIKFWASCHQHKEEEEAERRVNGPVTVDELQACRI